MNRIIRGCQVAVVFAAFVALPRPALAADHQGRLYGKVETTAGKSYTGVLRWGDQEAFWDDLFNSGKHELPYLEEFGQEREGRTFKILGRRLGVRMGADGRQFVARFGDIDRIEVLGRSEARLFMKDETEVRVKGSADDVEATIEVSDSAVGDVSVPWKRVASVDFLPTPADVSAKGYRLRGKVKTVAGDFEGSIQWDSQECLSFDKLDGEEDGIQFAIEMGKIRSIRRHSRRSAEVELKDGRTMILDGTNDVNDEIRGILVEDPRYGRVKIPWSAFRSLRLDDAGTSGPAYSEFKALGELRGTVIEAGGERYRGRLVFDLDEAYAWEMLDGERDGIAYTIPFALISAIEPRSSQSVEVELRNGEKLRLEGTQDTSDSNDGMLVVGSAEGDARYVSWRDVERLELEW